MNKALTLDRHDSEMIAPSTFQIVAQRTDSLLTTKSSRSDGGYLYTPRKSFGAAITQRIHGSDGAGTDPTAVTAKSRREGEPPHLIDILV